MKPKNPGLEWLLRTKIVAILRGLDPAKVIPVAEALHAGGVQAIEITMNSPGALELILKLSNVMQGKMLVGAGTVLDESMVKTAIHAGAAFIISPIVDEGVIETTRALGAVSIPGAYTPTEILQAHKYGGEIIKVFPAKDAAYIKDLRGPLPHIPLMPTGGITIENIKGFKDAGAVAFGVGSALVNSATPITDAYLKEIRLSASKLIKALV